MYFEIFKKFEFDANLSSFIICMINHLMNELNETKNLKNQILLH